MSGRVGLTRWFNRTNVRNCRERDECYCPHCPTGEHCQHADNENSDDCEEESCPRWNGKRWLKENGQ